MARCSTPYQNSVVLQPICGISQPLKGIKIGDARPPTNVRTAKAFARSRTNQEVTTVKVTG